MRPLSEHQFAALAIASTRGVVCFGDAVTHEDVAPFLRTGKFVDTSGHVVGRTLAVLTDRGLLLPDCMSPRRWRITPAGRKALEEARS